MGIKTFLAYYTAEYFKLSEFECKCGCGLGAETNNTIDVIYAPLIVALDLMRTRIGKPIIVNSGWRCHYWNEKKRGSPNSLHMSGNAADITCSDYPALWGQSDICKLFGLEIIRYDQQRFIHVQKSRR